MRYPVVIHMEKAGGCWLSFPDIPGTHTNGSSPEHALAHALDALETMLDFYFETKQGIPLPSAPKRGQKLVDLPPTVVAKILLHNEMLAQNIRPIDLAQRMGIPRQEVTRMLNPRHATKIDTTAQALAALGKRLELRIA